jgi:ERCC4-type nuclease
MQMCLADEKDWLKVKGVGKVLAKRMYEEIRKEVKPDAD